MTGPGNKILILLIGLLFLVPSVNAGGQKEGDVLVEVESLIQERQYNQAISLLTQVLKEQPQRFDDVNTLLQQVLQAQQEYNEKYDFLLETYETDLQESYVLIKELEEMKADANDRTRQSLIRARETAGFVFNRTRWEEIMTAALLQINAGEYWAAVETYRNGFDLSLDIFDDAGYDSNLVNQVDEEKAELNTFLDRFIILEQNYQEHSAAEDDAFRSGDLETFSASFELMFEDLRQLSQLLLVLGRAAERFDDLEKIIQQSVGNDNEVHHLVYLILLIQGRDDSTVREGLLGAVDEIWTSGTAILTEHANSLFNQKRDLAYAALRTEDFNAAREVFSEISEAAALDLKAVSLWAGRIRPNADGSLSEDDRAVIDFWVSRGNDTRYKSVIVAPYFDYMAGKEELDELDRTASAITEASDGISLRAEYQKNNESTQTLISSWNEEITALRRIRPEWLPENVTASIDELLEYLLENDAQAYAGELNLLAKMGAMERNLRENRLAGLEELYIGALASLQGLPLEVTAGEEIQIIQAVYPDQAVEGFNEIMPPLEELKGEIESLSRALAEDSLKFQEEPLIVALADRDDRMLLRINTLENGISSNLALAEDEILIADGLRLEGDRRLNESRQQLTRGQYPTAKERLNSAVARYDESLIHQESAALRNIRDVDIPALFEEIQREENKLVISQVREYLTEGQNLYSQTNFAAANTLFIRAQNRWADTNVEPNSEVEYWLELTKTALSVTTGREIAQTDPLFTEMIQYLNQATEDFNSGVNSLKRNNTEDADISFNQAERNLLYVQQFFPFNKAARVLTIKIAQQRDPQGFKELFSNDFNDARRQISINPQQAYVELKDLEAIDSRYPGIQAAITEAEYATGIKVRPADPRKLARSEELYADALAIFNNNNRTEFPVALAYLDEALALIPNYQNAIRLKDSVAVAMGGTSSEVLSSADQQKFQEAIDEYTAGNYLKAQIIVDILLNNQDNRNNTRLLELKERIDSVR